MLNSPTATKEIESTPGFFSGNFSHQIFNVKPRVPWVEYYTSYPIFSLPGKSRVLDYTYNCAKFRFDDSIGSVRVRGNLIGIPNMYTQIILHLDVVSNGVARVCHWSGSNYFHPSLPCLPFLSSLLLLLRLPSILLLSLSSPASLLSLPSLSPPILISFTPLSFLFPKG
jgi:hypothetical protein